MANRTHINLLVGKYRTIVISIAFFLVFDLAVLVLNYYISSQIKGDAAAVNMAGRQRMLSQRMVKSLYELEALLHKRQDISEPLKELTLTYGLFNTTLNSFKYGGNTLGGDGQSIPLAAVTSASGVEAINAALLIWKPFRERLVAVIDGSPGFMPAALNEAIGYAQQYNLRLLKLMNELTGDLETVAASKANRLRTIQTIGILLALGNFFLLLFHFLKQLKLRDMAIEAARQETDEILGTVNEGLFLIDADYRIGSQYSRQLETLLNDTNLAGRNFLALIEQHLPRDINKTAKDYLDLLFEGRVKEKLVTSLNPLQEVRFNSSDLNGRGKNKYLDFTFRRVVERGGVKHILVAVNDVTQKVILMKELEISEINNKIQIELLLDMLRVEPAFLKEFIDKTETELYAINHILKQQYDYEHRDKLKDIYLKVHTIKGNAAAIDMSLFEQRMHEFEDAIINVLDRVEHIDGKDFLKLAIKLESSLKLVDTVRGFLERIIEINRSLNQAPEPNLLAVSHFERLAQRISADKGKKVIVDHHKFNPELIPGDKKSSVRDILLQLVRNSVVHGIEQPGERKIMNKQEVGKITLTTEKDVTGRIKVVVRDDGRGIDVEEIRERAMQSGVWQADEVARWRPEQLISLIFEEQFSTAEKIDRDAGRGIGMSSVKHILKTLGGKLGIKYVPGEYCEFQISVPVS